MSTIPEPGDRFFYDKLLDHLKENEQKVTNLENTAIAQSQTHLDSDLEVREKIFQLSANQDRLLKVLDNTQTTLRDQLEVNQVLSQKVVVLETQLRALVSGVASVECCDKSGLNVIELENPKVVALEQRLENLESDMGEYITHGEPNLSGKVVRLEEAFVKLFDLIDETDKNFSTETVGYYNMDEAIVGPRPGYKELKALRDSMEKK